MDHITSHHIRETTAAVMDCRAVLIFLSLLITQAACRHVRSVTKSGALNATIRLMRQEIRTTLDHLVQLLPTAAPGLLPNISCVSLNTTDLVGPEPVTSHHLSLFRCYMLKMSKLTPEVSPQLLITSQYSQDVERLMTRDRAARPDCSLPPFEQNMDHYVFLKCLLDLLDQRLIKATF